MIAKLTYPRRREIPLWQWALVPLIGHFIIAASFWRPLVKNNTMTWGSFTYTIGRDKKVLRIEPAVDKPESDSLGAGTLVSQRLGRLVHAIARRSQGDR